MPPLPDASCFDAARFTLLRRRYADISLLFHEPHHAASLLYAFDATPYACLPSPLFTRCRVFRFLISH